MTERGWGRIVNVSSVNGQKGAFGQTNYSAAKAGMHGFTKALARELATKGVTVNTISPGYIGTKMVDRHPQGDPGYEDSSRDSGPETGNAGRGRGADYLPVLQRSRLHHGSQHLDQRRPAHAVGRAGVGRIMGFAAKLAIGRVPHSASFERGASQLSIWGQVCLPAWLPAMIPMCPPRTSQQLLVGAGHLRHDRHRLARRRDVIAGRDHVQQVRPDASQRRRAPRESSARPASADCSGTDRQSAAGTRRPRSERGR